LSSPTLIATGDRWVGYGVRSFLSVIDDVINGSKNDLIMTIYVINDKKIINLIRSALERGVYVEIFIYYPDDPEKRQYQYIIDELFSMCARYNYLKIHTINNEVLHAKVLVADGQKVIMGSANLTLGGMVKNYEMGFILNDIKIAEDVSGLLKKLV